MDMCRKNLLGGGIVALPQRNHLVLEELKKSKISGQGNKSGSVFMILILLCSYLCFFLNNS